MFLADVKLEILSIKNSDVLFIKIGFLIPYFYGIIFAKPYNEKYFNEYIEVIKKVMKKLNV